MKKLLLTLALGVAAFPAAAAVIKQWDFNTPWDQVDFDKTTGTVYPTFGSGSPARSIGGVTNSFNDVAGGATTDPNTVDNTNWRLGSVGGVGGFPAAAVGNKTAGAEFRVNTSGYSNIQVTWDQENSASASRYWRVQYTVDGINWQDHETVITANHTGPNEDGTGTPLWQWNLTADFSSISAANNNPDFGIRLVSEFESTATGSGASAYVANRPGASYSANGTLWLDMVTFSGDDMDPGNQHPQISRIEDQTIYANSSTAPLAFTISDAETPASSLSLSVHSSNPTLVNSAVFGGSGSSRTVVLIPEENQAGQADITIRVTDAGGKVSDSFFVLTVIKPTISNIDTQFHAYNQPLTIPFTVSNLPGDPASWVLTATSSNPSLISNGNITFGGSGTNRTVTITPQGNGFGETTIILTVSGGGQQASTSFLLKLLPELVVAYNLSALPNAVVESAPATTVAAGLTATPVVRGPTLGGANLTRGYSANSWNNIAAGTPATRENALLGDYFQFTVTIESGKTASLSSMDVSLRRSAVNAPMNYEWLYSFDGFATPGISMGSFNYYGRSSGTASTNVEPYSWMTSDVAGQGDGNPMSTMDLSGVSGLQNIPGGTTITFRLIGWGNDNTADSNTVALGRDQGPHIRGVVGQAGTLPATLIVTRSGNNVQISWPSSVSGTVQSASTLGSTWSDVVQTPTESGGNKTVTIPASGSQQFFRLRQ
ncbi:MAG: hypothetical protein ACK4UN_01415 [Limisphaerales bacterium]